MAKTDAKGRKDRGWTPYLIAGGVALVAGIVVSLVTGKANQQPASTTTTTVASGTQLYHSNVALQQGQGYGLDSVPPAPNQCADCILIEPAPKVGMSFSAPLGFDQWTSTTPPTYQECAAVLQSGSRVAVASLYAPPSYMAGARPGTYFCVYSNNGSVLRMRYDGANRQATIFRFDVTAWTA